MVVCDINWKWLRNFWRNNENQQDGWLKNNSSVLDPRFKIITWNTHIRNLYEYVNIREEEKKSTEKEVKGCRTIYDSSELNVGALGMRDSWNGLTRKKYPVNCIHPNLRERMYYILRAREKSHFQRVSLCLFILSPLNTRVSISSLYSDEMNNSFIPTHS